MIWLRILGVLIVIVGFALRYLVKRRRFNRRGPAGLEHFKSYEAAWSTKLFETVLLIMAYVFMIGGIFFCIAFWDFPEV